MTDAEDDRVRRRAELLPEEQEAGSDAPVEQAQAILADSDFRTEHPEDAAEQSKQSRPD